jgi:Peptidase MA superfamily
MTTRSLITRRLFVSLASLTLLALSAPAPGQATVSQGAAVRAQLGELLDSMERAVLSGEIEGYLWHLDMSDAVFAQEQKNWAADLEKRAPETFEITLSDEDLHVEGNSATVEMQMTWNMPDSKRRQVTFPARFTRGAMEDEPGAWKYAGENWEHALGEHVVALYLDGLQDHGQVVVDVWPEVWSSVNERFGVAPEDAAKEPAQQVKLYKSMAHLQASIFLSYADEHGSLGGWNEPGESIKAMARGRPSKGGQRTLLSHEYGHVRTFLLGPEANAMPWWLLEGLAEFASEPFAQTRRYSEGAVKRYAQNETLAPWNEIADFEKTPKQYIGHVYRQGHHMVMFVTDTFGDEKRTQWARLMAQGKSLDEATREALGISFKELDHNWRESLKDDGL